MQIYDLPSDANSLFDFPARDDLLRVVHWQVHRLLKRGRGRVRLGPSQQGNSHRARGR